LAHNTNRLDKKAFLYGDNVRQSCVLTVLLAASGPCLAQTSVEPYGIIDVGLRSQDGLSANNTPALPGYTNSVSSGVDNTSRWGIKGQESLGGGWHALFRLEGGINADTGTSAKGDRLFDRMSLVGLDSPYGTVAVGRQANLISDALLPVDPLGKRFATRTISTASTTPSNTPPAPAPGRRAPPTRSARRRAIRAPRRAAAPHWPTSVPTGSCPGWRCSSAAVTTCRSTPGALARRSGWTAGS
jgi:hypothetical protein